MTRTVGLLAVLGALQVSGQALQFYNTLYQQPYYNKQYGFHKTQYNGGFGSGGYGSGGFGYGGYGYGHGFDNKRKRVRPQMLTCVADDGYSNGALSANIVEKHSFDNVFNNAFNYGYGSNPRSRGLKATFELLSDNDADVSLILSEKGFIHTRGCDRDNFGRGLAPFKSTNSDNRGGYSYAGGYGDGNGGGGYNNGYGFASADLFHGGKNDGYDIRRSKRTAPVGVLIEADLDGGTVQVFTLQHLEGYTDIKHLAGRSLILCTDVDEDYDHRAVCNGEVLACCVLGFDHEDRFIDSEVNSVLDNPTQTMRRRG